MTLQKKAIAIAVLIIVSAVTLISAIAQVIVMRSFEELERQDVVKNVERLRSLLQDDLANLDRAAGDYATWDDTYQFAQHPDDRYIRSSLNKAAFVENRLNLLLIVNPQGRILFARGFDLERQQTAPVPNILAYFSPDAHLLQHRQTDSGIKGLLILPEGPLLLSSRPILTSDGRGPARGTLIMGRYLNSREVDLLSANLHLPVHLSRASGTLTPEAARALSQPSSDDSITVKTLNRDTIAGCYIMSDLYGKPGLTFEVIVPRSIMQSGRAAIRCLMLSLGLLGLQLCALILLFLDKLLFRVTRISRGVIEIGKSGDLSARLPVEGSDEIGSLAAEINRMLQALEGYTEQICASENRYRQLFHEALTGNCLSTPDGRVLLCNTTFASMFKFDSVEEAMHTNLASLFPEPQERQDYLRLIKERKKLVHHELRLLSRDGAPIHAIANASGVFDEEGQLVQIQEYLLDITDRKQMEDKLQYLVTHDPLTNLPNRQFFVEALKRAVARARRGDESALFMIDLDNFKLINDTLGHNIGDNLLVSIVNNIRSRLGEEALLARFGGDEFVVLLEGLTAAEAEAAAEGVRRSVEEAGYAVNSSSQSICPTVSIGVTMVNGKLDPRELLSHADAALHIAKEQGRNRTFLVKPQENLAARLEETSGSLAFLQRSLREEQLMLYFQPVVNLATGGLIHYEALLRLIDESGRPVSAGKYIAYAERFGLMPQIDRWLLKSAIRFLTEHPDLKLFVNLSGSSLGDNQLLDFVTGCLQQTAIDPSRLGFEITETTAVKDMEQAEKWILALKRLGCQFALDDFGISFSSLSYLRLFSVDYIKIDGSFVRNLDGEPVNQALVQAMNFLAHTMGKRTIAEYVENEEDRRALIDLQIDYGQGYLFGKPSPFLHSGEPGEIVP